MTEKKTTSITIDEVEYVYEDMTEEQQTLVSHVADLDRKIRSAEFNLSQLVGGRQFFMGQLKEKLDEA